MNINLLLSITFVFGVIRLLTQTKLFTFDIRTPMHALFGITNREQTILGGIIVFLDNAFFYFSLIFQAWYWLFKNV